MIKTRAAVMVGKNQPMGIGEMEVPEPGPHQVIVKQSATGLCLSQVHQLQLVPDAQWERQEVVAVSGQTEVPVIVVARDGRRHVFLEETHPELPGLLNL